MIGTVSMNLPVCVRAEVILSQQTMTTVDWGSLQARIFLVHWTWDCVCLEGEFSNMD